MQLINVSSSIIAILDGILMLVREVHPLKQCDSIISKPSFSVTVSIVVLFKNPYVFLHVSGRVIDVTFVFLITLPSTVSTGKPSIYEGSTISVLFIRLFPSIDTAAPSFMIEYLYIFPASSVYLPLEDGA